jgi:hypothetical protein
MSVSLIVADAGGRVGGDSKKLLKPLQFQSSLADPGSTIPE